MAGLLKTFENRAFIVECQISGAARRIDVPAIRPKSPVWCHKLRHVSTVTSGLFQYPLYMVCACFGRTTISPGTPAGTSLSSSSTIRTS